MQTVLQTASCTLAKVIQTDPEACNHENQSYNDNKDEPKLAKEAVVVVVRDDLKGPVVHESLSVLDGTAAAREKDLERQMSHYVSMELETGDDEDLQRFNDTTHHFTIATRKVPGR
jgi:hypothetical protein